MTELYKRYRPRTFDKMFGCTETGRALSNMLERETLPHTILFHGPSGCGKTTLARILKEKLECDDLDFREVNSASFKGIDTIRDIQKVMNLAPAAGPCRIWLLDEVHKLTNDAQNAALKMLEDTPSHVYFFLCTTDPQKLIKAVLTRCCEMPVRLLTQNEIEQLLDRVCKKESISLHPKAKDEIVTCSGGSARTALVLLDKVSHLAAEEQAKAVEATAAEQNEAIELCRALIKRESWKKVASIIANMKGDPETIRYNVIGYARAVLLKEDNYQAYLVLSCFKNNFYDSKEAGLVYAAYEAIHAK